MVLHPPPPITREMLTLCMMGNFPYYFCCQLICLKITILKKIFREYHPSVKQFGSRSGQTFCLSRPGSKMFAKDIGRQQNLLLAWKEQKPKKKPKVFNILLRDRASQCIKKCLIIIIEKIKQNSHQNVEKYGTIFCR